MIGRGSIASKQASKRMSTLMGKRMSMRNSMFSGPGGAKGKGGGKEPAGPPPWLKTARKGDRLWMLDKENVYVAVNALGINKEEKILNVKLIDTGEERKVPLADIWNIYPGNEGESFDMTGLPHINEACILQNLKLRAAKQLDNPVAHETYTFMASVLIAMNPLARKTNPPNEQFVNAPARESHPFCVAEQAYKQMCSNIPDVPRSQSVVISGESGAGKTESSKIVLQHLTFRGSNEGAVEGLDKKIIETNPILESFGNAKTFRNPNSSRFGKFMKLQFNEKGKARNLLAGGMIETYLLEKSRLVFQMKGERNYHVFYQLFTGGSDAQKAEWRLDDPEKFNYLNQSGCVKVEQIDDKAEFADLDAAILQCIPEGGAEKKGTLFQIERVMVTMGETIIVQRSASAAKFCRDSVVKEMYSRIFVTSLRGQGVDRDVAERGARPEDGGRPLHRRAGHLRLRALRAQRLQHRLRQRRRRLLTGPVRHRQGDR
jgi:myosin heavy subunit